MAKTTLPLAGIAKWQNFTFENCPKGRERIRSAIEKDIQGAGTPIDASEFFSDIERAIKWALFNKNLAKHSRLQVREGIKKIQGAKTIDEVREKLPIAIRSWLFTKEISPHLADTQHKVSRAVRLISARAERELVGRGRDKDMIPVLLASDIAEALKKIGIKPIVSSPDYPEKSSVYCLTVQECFKIVGFSDSDSYRQMRLALRKKGESL
jgi:hypothetical protein